MQPLLFAPAALQLKPAADLPEHKVRCASGRLSADTLPTPRGLNSAPPLGSLTLSKSKFTLDVRGVWISDRRCTRGTDFLNCLAVRRPTPHPHLASPCFAQSSCTPRPRQGHQHRPPGLTAVSAAEGEGQVPAGSCRAVFA